MVSLKPAVTANDHFIGSLNTAIILVEYGDFQCPHCGRAHHIIQKLLRETGENIRFVFRQFSVTGNSCGGLYRRCRCRSC